MTKDEIFAEFNVDSKGYIRTPGKFEGTKVWTPYYWALALEGCADETLFIDDVTYDVFTVTEEDRNVWRSLESPHILVWEDSNGFVHAVGLNTEDLMRWRVLGEQGTGGEYENSY